jgi:hypothetical protein
MNWIRTQLRRIILWALAGAPETQHDAAGLDEIAAKSKT